MGLNDFSGDIDGYDESGGLSGSLSEDVSKAYKDEIKKASKQIKKTKKDEKKSKKHDLLLAKFLVKILLERKYDKLFPLLFGAFDSGVPSNIILGVMSLVYLDISHSIREGVGKEIITFNFSIESTLTFSGEDLPKEIKNRVNFWIEDIESVSIFNATESSLKKAKYSLEESEVFYDFTVEVFIYFLSENNIYIKKEMAQEYILFIFNNILLPRLQNMDL